MQWFINEQVEKDAWTAEMVMRVEPATCSGGLQGLEGHVLELLEDDKE